MATLWKQRKIDKKYCNYINYMSNFFMIPKNYYCNHASIIYA
jgi:hypothetical protein